MKYMLGVLAACILLVACATKEKPVFLERADVLPLELNDAFQFRKTQLTFHDPRNYVRTQSETLNFLRRRIDYGAITPLDFDEITGNYFSFFWRTSTRADVTARLEYRQAGTGNLVLAQERYYPAAKGSYQSDFQVTGDEYFENGRVLAWRAVLIVDRKIVAFTQSFLWK